MEIRPADELQQQELLELQATLREQEGMTFKFKKMDGRFVHTFCTGQLLQKLGLSAQDVVGKGLDFLPADAAARKEAFYEQAWRGEEQIAYEGELNGLHYLASLRPVRRDGQVIEVIASCVDITERKKAEEELRTTKEMLESLIEHSVDGICVTDMEGTVLRVNPAFVELYGWAEQELVGIHMPIFPEQMKAEFIQIRRQLESGIPIVNAETIRQRKDGTLLHVSLTISPIKDANGRIVAMTGITRDITESKRTEEFLRKSDKLNVVGQLAAGLAHEIRNPLTSLKGFVQFMQSGGREKPEYFDIMLSELDRISGIINEFLFIAKPQDTGFQFNELPKILLHVATLLDSEAAMCNVQIVMETDGTIPPILCSEIQIKQVFLNMVKNAIEAMPGGGIVRISAINDSERDRVFVRIADQGGGIPENQIHRLGDPFYTTKEKGTGLGLMMCYKMVEAHQGSISINSAVGNGTTIEVMLPTRFRRSD